jgi:2-oxo-4-hydroxy-4-carboxy-5-ureidoimidazoline decarboxylase
MVITARPDQLLGLDDQPADVATGTLRSVCASERWVAEVVAGRPYGELSSLIEAADSALDNLDWADVEQALGAHPRVGDRAEGGGREAAWSRAEQSAAATDAADVRAELRAANVAYEDRFGWVFLVCASGRTAEEILAAARARLGNDVATEQDVIRAELRDIVRLRLAKAFARTSLSTHVLDAVTGRPAAAMGVRLEAREVTDWIAVASAVTDADGRVTEVFDGLGPGIYRLVFDTDGWLGADAAFYPEVVITFRVTADDRHLHVPLLLSPFSYSTYRGS